MVQKVAIPNGFAYDLTDWYNNTPTKKFFIQDSVEYSTRDGKLVTAPAAVTRPMGLFYNSDLYKPEKAVHDMTVDEFIASPGRQQNCVPDRRQRMVFHAFPLRPGGQRRGRY